jgi:hypothetical protein
MGVARGSGNANDSLLGKSLKLTEKIRCTENKSLKLTVKICFFKKKMTLPFQNPGEAPVRHGWSPFKV